MLDKLRHCLDWTQRIVALIDLVKLLFALGLGATVRTMLATQIPNIWLTPIWLLSSAVILWLLTRFVGAKPKSSDRSNADGATKGGLVHTPLDDREVKIARLSDQVDYFPTLLYPLKLRVQMRNDSPCAIDVQLKEYRPNKIAASPKGFPLDVLQLRFGNTWLPATDGANRIAVLPTQQFQAWIGLNERLSNKPEVESHRSQIGTLVLLVNNRNVEMTL
jgi:hypothetical protein